MRTNYVILFLFMGLATYLTRVGFFVFSKKIVISNLIYRSLKYIPISILASLIFPGILIPNGKLNIAITNPFIYAGIVTTGAVLMSKNSILSILLGIVSLIVLRIFM